eukprot:tig00000334_g24109.t1
MSAGAHALCRARGVTAAAAATNCRRLSSRAVSGQLAATARARTDVKDAAADRCASPGADTRTAHASGEQNESREGSSSSSGAGEGESDGTHSNSRGSSGGGFSFSPSGLWSWYKEVLARHPLRTIAVQSAVIGAMGDVVAQRIEGKHDPRRVAKLFAWGFCFNGPVGHFFYGYLDRRFPTSGGWGNVARKVCINSALLSPVINFLFLSFVRAVDVALEGDAGRIPEEVKAKLEAEWLPSYLNSLCFWPAVHAVNFGFLPAEYRMLVLSVASVFWTAYLSFVGHRAAARPAAPVPPALDLRPT